jgi:hypothetical protein
MKNKLLLLVLESPSLWSHLKILVSTCVFVVYILTLFCCRHAILEVIYCFEFFRGRKNILIQRWIIKFSFLHRCCKNFINLIYFFYLECHWPSWLTVANKNSWYLIKLPCHVFSLVVGRIPFLILTLLAYLMRIKHDTWIVLLHHHHTLYT